MIGTSGCKRRAITLFRSAAIALLLAASALSATPPVPPGPIRIGVIGPLTGSNQSAGVGQLNAVRLAAEEFNKMGGAHGRLVEIIEADDQGQPLQSAAGVDRLLRGGAVAVLGAINSSCTLAIMEPCARARTPLLTSSSTATRVTATGNKWVFRCIESDYFRMAELSRYLTEELSLRRIGILYDNDDFGRGLMADFTRSLEQHNLELAYAQPFRRDQADFSAELQEIQRQGIEALGLFGITPDNIRLAKLVREKQLPVQLFAPDVTERYLASWRDVESLVATDSYFLLQDKPAARQFAARYKRRFGIAAGPHAGRAYDAACILFQAIRRTPDPRREALRDAISATENFPGVTGDFNFKANGDVVKKIQIIAIHNGAFVPAQEWRVRSDYRRWILILIPS
ncbi:MAG TPA: ABC transporter substrate-binding protein, partial [Acidobacteriota bacterium]|nr:ABC transporter substrate-binding protein [Acidobacteriota bacterium]